MPSKTKDAERHSAEIYVCTLPDRRTLPDKDTKNPRIRNLFRSRIANPSRPENKPRGPAAACGAALRARLIGARSHRGELDALIRAEDAGLAAGLAVSPANLEQIMVHLEREAET